ncbi:MAG: polysaccharide biosynthesis/export family protein, partial [Isosphaeraceae bacterium]
MSRHRAKYCAALGGLLVLVCLGEGVLTARQEPAKEAPRPPGAATEKKEAPPEPAPPAEGEKPAPPAHKGMTAAEARAAVDKVFENYDLKPHGLPAIPDNPPPHEGAMISEAPYVIEPPDLVLVEVLEALPGRPISGERLVRSDGKISLGFYGEVHVAGLTIEQAKVKIIKHMRQYLSDECLGLLKFREEDGMEPMPEWPKGEIKIPALPGPGRAPFDLDEDKKPNEEAKKPDSAAASYPRRSTVRRTQIPYQHARPRPQGRVRLIARRQEQDENRPEEPKKPVEVPLEAGGKVTVTIEVQAGEKKEVLPQAEIEGSQIIEGVIAPEACLRVLVDVTAYNSKNYYVQGDVAAPGRLPCT